ncbi:NUDIX hydrolase [Variovorax sp. HJSM1_2]|uniref:NUDIX hydrolase n=1 Tax=Variovorax sp. HJSM1_2 TaxID=3366263 RepID=UPI003BC9F719
MELNYSVVTSPPVAAASLVLLRDGAQGLEVFLVRRHQASNVLGGAHVFPGGKVDAADAAPAWQPLLDQPAAVLQAALGEAETDATTASAIFVAALREAFEEAGVLFAQASSPEQLAQVRQALREEVALRTALTTAGLGLSSRAVTPWSRWITPTSPSVMDKRFDTRFFLAAVPPGQTAVHDDFETTDSLWLSPRAALTQYWDGQLKFAPPQILSLSALARFAHVADALADARSRPPPVVRPEPFDEAGVRVICYPGDPRHSLPQAVVPGPTRLSFRHQRFEPEGGFEAFFN